uniref:Uncharacterized protein n=1 Tax=Anguilla anguilla TaxID=7936 RepID=A0A0E9RV06_ANGAN
MRSNQWMPHVTVLVIGVQTILIVRPNFKNKGVMLN